MSKADKNIDLDEKLIQFQNQVGEFPSDYAKNVRLSPQKIAEQMVILENHFRENNDFKGLLDCLHFVIIVLNSDRQIIFANRAFLILINRQLEEILGLRFGEAIGCAYALNSEFGCGSTKNCSQCSAINGQLQLLQHHNTNQVNCSVLTHTNDSLELELNYTPIKINNEIFIITSAVDVQEKNHRDMLERTVLHDIQNTIGALGAFSEELLQLVQEASNPRIHALSKMIQHISTIATDELQAHSQLVNIEIDSVRVTIKTINLDDYLSEIVDLYATFPWARRCYFIKEAHQRGISIDTDGVLLKRILVNLLKNAAEAEVEQEKPPILIGWGHDEDGVYISVHNRSMIPETMQLQMFRKYMSTKGKGRGIGTFSIKVLTERYLNGTVSFKSSKNEGTTFKITLPLKLI